MALEGAMEKVRSAYFGLEDKWYSVIDKIDSKIPIHGLVDRIDRVFPSFALFLIIVLIVIAIFLIPALLPSGAMMSFRVADADGSPVSGALVEAYSGGEKVFSERTNAAGETGYFSVVPGSTVTIAVSKDDFLDYSETLELETSMLFYGIVLEALEEKSYTISLKDSLGQPIREPLTLSFSCRNPDVAPPADLLVSSGVATAIEPKGCNGLVVSVRGGGFEPKDSVLLENNQQTIYLQESIGDTGTINVELYYNSQLVSEEIVAYLYKDNGTDAGLGPVDTETTFNGGATFEAQPGTYFVRTSGQGSYSATATQVFSLSAGDIKPVRIDLQKNIVGIIKLKIVDEVTLAAVDGASVLLRLGGQDIDTKVSDGLEDGIVEFPVVQDTSYTVIVDHEGYCLKVVQDASIGSSVREIKLKPFDQDCGGRLKVRVLDQSGFPVRNATVGLYSEAGFSVGFANLITDINGEALFNRVPSGDYKAFAFKESSSGWSDPEHFAQRTAEQTILTVVLIAGDGVIKVNVKDDEGMPVQFAQAAFVDALTFETIGGGAMPVQDINGTVELTTRADKRVYVVVSKQGYANFTSTVVPVVAGTTQEIDAVLEKEIIQGEVKLELKGLYKDGRAVSVLAPGQEYEALFQLRVPANKNYDSVGMHVRTGKNEIMELDKIVIKSLNAPGRASIIKATAFSPSSGYDADSSHLSSDEAKWANIKWGVFISGITQVKVKIRVKETATLGDQLILFYRAWGEYRGSYKRDPLDSELGEAESVPGKNGLYAKANEKTLQIGTETTCDEKFCFSASIEDIENRLVYMATEGFSGKVQRPYRLSFTVSNNSGFDTDTYLDAEVRVSNLDSGLGMQSYQVFGAQNQSREGLASNDSTGWVEAGNIFENNSVSGYVSFTPEKSGFGQLLIEIRSGQRIRFSKTISVSIASDKELSVLISPEMPPSGIENSITVTVKDKRTNAETNNAIVKARDRFGTVVAERMTNKMGIAVLKLPALQPGEKLVLTVGKPDYETFEKELGVDPAVIAVKPQTMGVSLNAKTVFEAKNDFSVENLTSFDMKIKGLALNGKVYGLIDREKVNDWLFAYAGEEIKSGQAMEMQLMTFLTEKGKKITKTEQLEAELEITMEAFGSEWTTNVPVKISIGLGGEVDDPTCFTITRKEWKASTEGNPVEIQFEAQNNCSISSAPVSLRNLSAEAAWESNQVGTFSVRTETNAIDLRSGYAKKFAGVLGPEESIPIVLTFTPSPGVNGKGIASIVFSAENPTESGAQVLEDSIAAELVVVNLLDCIGFSKEVLVIKPEESDSFTVETAGCGASNTIKLETDLTTSTSQFVLGETGTQEVEVLAEKNMPGQYPIWVFAKGSDEVQEKLIKTIRVRISSDGCLDLSRYEFDVFDNPDDPYDGYDTAELYNKCYDQHVIVHVKFDEHSWTEAMKTGALVGLLTGLLGGISASMQGNNFLTGKPNETAANAAASQKMTYEEFMKGGAVPGLKPGDAGVKRTISNTEVFVPAGQPKTAIDAKGNTYDIETTGGECALGLCGPKKEILKLRTPAKGSAAGAGTGTTGTGSTSAPVSVTKTVGGEQLDLKAVYLPDGSLVYKKEGGFLGIGTKYYVGGTLDRPVEVSGSQADYVKLAMDGKAVAHPVTGVWYAVQTGLFGDVSYISPGGTVINSGSADYSLLKNGLQGAQSRPTPQVISGGGGSEPKVNISFTELTHARHIATLGMNGELYQHKRTGDYYFVSTSGSWFMGKNPAELTYIGKGSPPNYTGSFALAPGTGYQGLLGGGAGGSLGGGMAGGMGNMAMGMGQSLFGQPSFLGWGLMGFIGGTLWAYSQMEEGEFSFPTIGKDLEISGIMLLLPGASWQEEALVEEESTDIIVSDLGETSTEPREDDEKLSMEIRKLGFVNATGVVQKDPATPLYRVLRVDGDRIVWETEYELDEKTNPELEEKERKDYKERFRLQFNAFDPMAVTPESRPIPNCTLGTVTGVTGPNAVPRVSFDWSWDKIGEDSCDEGNPDYIYCDATQFSIAVLKKVQALRTFIEANKPFTCPSSASAVSVKEQPIEGTAYDVAITRMQATKTGEKDANIFVTVESNNGQPMNAELRIDLKEGQSLVKSCTKSIDLISKVNASCEFSGLGEKTYTALATLTPVLCSGCENSKTANDKIEAQLVFGSTGIASCEPYNTKRLVKFLEAGNFSAQQIEEVQKLISFNAYLIEDAYTKDFRADFDLFCKTKSFFDCPLYYLDEDGLHRFFPDSEKFNFDYSMAPQAPADAGKYAVTLNIEFDNSNWDFFTNGMPDATVNVEMTELSAPEPNNPFYYMPFDGLVGVDSDNGRQGYGVNFRQASEKTIKINNASDQTVVSTNIAGSTPVFNGWVETAMNDQFAVLNQVNRGILLDVRSEADGTKVVLSPSYATPVIMEVSYEKGNDAFGFYSVEIDNAPQTNFTKMLPWSGIGVNCRDFKDNPVTEAWQDTWDFHGGVSGNLSCAVGTEIADYGVEWCSPIRSGPVFLQTVVFTPQGKDSIMKRTAYSDEMSLYNADETGGSSQISLNGVPGMKNNSFGTSGIDSIEDVFDLVKENKVCLVGQGSRISNKFFWNPKVVLEEISDLRGKAEGECIGAG